MDSRGEGEVVMAEETRFIVSKWGDTDDQVEMWNGPYTLDEMKGRVLQMLDTEAEVGSHVTITVRPLKPS